MADEHLLKKLQEGNEAWNKWRAEHPEADIDLSEADLSGIDFSNFNLHKANLSKTNLYKSNLSKTNLRNANFSGANLHENNLSEADIQGAIYIETNLSGANLTRCNLTDANLSKANLSGKTNLTNADLYRSNLYRADLSGCILCGADLSEANLYGANLSNADLTGASIRKAIFVEVNLEGSILTNSFVYGLSAWGCIGIPKDQSNLIITPLNEVAITVDDLHVAQFIYLLLDHKKLRNVLETITSKSVLILGRFTPERKIILNAITEELRKYNLLPIIFDFERATSLDFTETIKILAGMSIFVIVDITNPKSSPLELQATVPDYEKPFIPIIQDGEDAFSMFNDLTKYPWMLKLKKYSSLENLRSGVKPVIVDRAWEKRKEIEKRKNENAEVESFDDFMKKSLTSTVE